jgi:hypothetical protein
MDGGMILGPAKTVRGWARVRPSMLGGPRRAPKDRWTTDAGVDLGALVATDPNGTVYVSCPRHRRGFEYAAADVLAAAFEVEAGTTEPEVLWLGRPPRPRGVLKMETPGQ